MNNLQYFCIEEGDIIITNDGYILLVTDLDNYPIKFFDLKNNVQYGFESEIDFSKNFTIKEVILKGNYIAKSIEKLL